VVLFLQGFGLLHPLFADDTIAEAKLFAPVSNIFGAPARNLFVGRDAFFGQDSLVDFSNAGDAGKVVRDGFLGRGF